MGPGATAAAAAADGIVSPAAFAAVAGALVVVSALLAALLAQRWLASGAGSAGANAAKAAPQVAPEAAPACKKQRSAQEDDPAQRVGRARSDCGASEDQASAGRLSRTSSATSSSGGDDAGGADPAARPEATAQSQAKGLSSSQQRRRRRKAAREAPASECATAAEITATAKVIALAATPAPAAPFAHVSTAATPAPAATATAGAGCAEDGSAFAAATAPSTAGGSLAVASKATPVTAAVGNGSAAPATDLPVSSIVETTRSIQEPIVAQASDSDSIDLPTPADFVRSADVVAARVVAVGPASAIAHAATPTIGATTGTAGKLSNRGQVNPLSGADARDDQPDVPMVGPARSGTAPESSRRPKSAFNYSKKYAAAAATAKRAQAKKRASSIGEPSAAVMAAPAAKAVAMPSTGTVEAAAQQQMRARLVQQVVQTAQANTAARVSVPARAQALARTGVSQVALPTAAVAAPVAPVGIASHRLATASGRVGWGDARRADAQQASRSSTCAPAQGASHTQQVTTSVPTSMPMSNTALPGPLAPQPSAKGSHGSTGAASGGIDRVAFDEGHTAAFSSGGFFAGIAGLATSDADAISGSSSQGEGDRRGRRHSAPKSAGWIDSRVWGSPRSRNAAANAGQASGKQLFAVPQSGDSFDRHAEALLPSKLL